MKKEKYKQGMNPNSRNGFEKGHTKGFKKGQSGAKGRHWKVKDTSKMGPKKGKKYPKMSENHRDQYGAKNSSWKGGISFEPYTTDWTESLRRTIRERDRYTCQLCGKPQGDRVHSVHHIDYDKKNCNPENLITLCCSCNTKVNSNREYWTNYFYEKVFN